MATTIVFERHGQAAYTFAPGETMTQSYISLHPFGAFLLGLNGVVTNVLATVNNMDNSEYEFYKLATITNTTCQCGNPLLTATWTQMQ